MQQIVGSDVAVFDAEGEMTAGVLQELLGVAGEGMRAAVGITERFQCERAEGVLDNGEGIFNFELLICEREFAHAGVIDGVAANDHAVLIHFAELIWREIEIAGEVGFIGEKFASERIHDVGSNGIIDEVIESAFNGDGPLVVRLRAVGNGEKLGDVLVGKHVLGDELLEALENALAAVATEEKVGAVNFE